MAILDDQFAAPQPLRKIGDYDATRQAIFDGTLAAVQKRFPLTNRRYALGVENLRYDSPKPFTIKQQKQAVLGGGTIEK